MRKVLADAAPNFERFVNGRIDARAVGLFVTTDGHANRNAGQLTLESDRWRLAGSNDRSPVRPLQKPCLRQRVEHAPAVIDSKIPQTYGLRERQLQTRHLHAVGPRAINESCEAHIPDRATGEPNPHREPYAEMSFVASKLPHSLRGGGGRRRSDINVCHNF